MLSQDGRFGFIGPGYQTRGKVGDTERWMNMYIERIESQLGAASPTEFQAFNTPGKALLVTTDDSPSAGIAATQNPDLGNSSGPIFFAVGGQTLYAIAVDTSTDVPTGTATAIGAIDKVENPFAPGQLLPCMLVVISPALVAVLCPSGNLFVAAFGGAILTSSLNSGGAGYAVGDTGAISGGLISAVYIVVTVSGGAVTSYMLVGGTGYVTNTDVQTQPGGSQPGSGTGFTIDITAVDADAWLCTMINGSPLAPALGTDTFIQSITFLDGYLIAGLSENSPGEFRRIFYVSGLNDVNTWSPLDFGVKEASPDGIKAVYAAFEILNVMGVSTAELWQNTGNALFPFQRLPGGGVVPVGLASPWLIATGPKSIVWLAADGRGQYVAYQMAGSSPQRLSNHAIENHWANFNTTGANVYTYAENGHTFAVFNFPEPDETWVCDLDLGPMGWHERGSWDGESFHADLARYHAFASSDFSGTALHAVGDYGSGNIYLQSMDYLNQDCEDIRRIRVTPHVFNQKQWQVFPRFRLQCLTGVDTGTFNLRISKDGGQTFGAYLPVDIGTAGQYEKLIDWYIRVRCRDLVLEWSCDNPISLVLVEGYLQGAYQGSG